jgi:hypothetical protein
MMALLLAPPVGTVMAETQGKTNCQATGDFEASPGFFRDGNSGTFTTNGETGTVTCDGPVNGKRPTGPGTYGASGRYGTPRPADCGQAAGDYQNSMTIPTADGPQTVKNHGTWSSGAFKSGGAFSGSFTGDTADGTFEVTPEEGDCFSRPMTRFSLALHWTLK